MSRVREKLVNSLNGSDDFNAKGEDLNREMNSDENSLSKVERKRMKVEEK